MAAKFAGFNGLTEKKASIDIQCPIVYKTETGN